MYTKEAECKSNFELAVSVVLIVALVLATITLVPIQKAKASDGSPPTITSFSLNSGAGFAKGSERIVSASGVFNDPHGAVALKVQFSQDGINWGAYSGSGTTNNKSTGWNYYKTITASATAQTIASAFYLEGSDGAKTLYVRARNETGTSTAGSSTFSDTFTASTYNESGTTTANWDTTSGEIKLPPGAPIDHVLVAEYYNYRVQIFDSAGNYIRKFTTKYAERSYSDSHGIVVDSDNNISVIDSGNWIQRFDYSGNFLAKWGSNGSGDGQFYLSDYYAGMSMDANENIYVADHGNRRVQKFDSLGNYLDQWGSVGSGNGQFSDPGDVTIDSNGDIYVVDLLNYRVQKFDSSFNYLSELGTGTWGPADGQFDWVEGASLAVDSNDNLYVTDVLNYRVQKFDSAGNFVRKWGSFGSADGQFNDPYGIAVDSQDNIYVAEFPGNRVQKFDSDGTFLTKWGTFGSGDGQFDGPSGLAINTNPAYTPASNIVQSKTVDSKTSTITKATLTAVESNDSGTSVSYQLSRDGGSTWESATSGSEHTFTSSGAEKSDLKWKATLANGTSTATAKIQSVNINYSYSSQSGINSATSNALIKLDTYKPRTYASRTSATRVNKKKAPRYLKLYRYYRSKRLKTRNRTLRNRYKRAMNKYLRAYRDAINQVATAKLKWHVKDPYTDNKAYTTLRIQKNVKSRSRIARKARYLRLYRAYKAKYLGTRNRTLKRRYLRTTNKYLRAYKRTSIYVYKTVKVARYRWTAINKWRTYNYRTNSPGTYRYFVRAKDQARNSQQNIAKGSLRIK